MLQLFAGDAYRALKMGLDASSLRHQVISNNIANVDTPRFRNRVVLFEDELKQALFPGDDLTGRTTRAEHIPIGPQPFGRVDAKVTLSPAVTWRVDGNTVDIDLEATRMIQNSGKYEAMSRLAAEYHRELRIAISGGTGG